MRRLLLALFLLFGLCMTTYAQMQKGSWMADGQVGMVLSNLSVERETSSLGEFSESNKVTNFYLLPGVGYFIQDNLALGLSGNFQVISGKGQTGENDPIRGNSFMYGTGLFLREYIPAGEKLSFYGDLRVGGVWGNFGWIDDESSDRTVSRKLNGFEGTASVGVQYLVKDFLGLHLQSALFDYERIKQTGVEYESSSINSSLNARLFSSFQIGATVFF